MATEGEKPLENLAMWIISGLIQIGGSNKGALSKLAFTYCNRTLSADKYQEILKKEHSIPSY
jgi:hypothetical protein